MTKLTDVTSGSTQPTTVRVAIIKPAQEVLFVDRVAAVDLGVAGKVLINEEALKQAYPGGNIVYIDDEVDLAPGYIWTENGFQAPTTKKIVTWEFFSLFTQEEQARYFAALDANNLQVRALAEMLRLQSGSLIEGDHPVVQYGLYVMRLSGIIATDERLTEMGNILQGIETEAPV